MNTEAEAVHLDHRAVPLTILNPAAAGFFVFGLMDNSLDRAGASAGCPERTRKKFTATYFRLSNIRRNVEDTSGRGGTRRQAVASRAKRHKKISTLSRSCRNSLTGLSWHGTCNTQGKIETRSQSRP